MNTILSATSKKLTILARSCSNLALRSSIVMLVSVELSSPPSAGPSAVFGEMTCLSSSVCDCEVEDNSWADMVLMQVAGRLCLGLWVIM